jgi:hypothetical protein
VCYIGNSTQPEVWKGTVHERWALGKRCMEVMCIVTIDPVHDIGGNQMPWDTRKQEEKFAQLQQAVG